MNIHGDCVEEMAKMAANSVDAIVTDPPAGIAFMNKSWDKDRGGRNQWIEWMTEVAHECLRVIKPGGHALVWALPRTSHWTATAWEDAGFEVRERIAYVFGSGFPKSHDVSKAIDKVNGETGRLLKFVEWVRMTGLKAQQINKAIGKSDVGSHYLRRDQPAIPTCQLWAKLRPLCGDIPAWVDELVERIEAERLIIGKLSAPASSIYSEKQLSRDVNLTVPATDAARQWQGWGTALKPAMEDWWLLRKPLSEKTVAENVLKWGTGAINVDGCRVGVDRENERQLDKENASGKEFGFNNKGLIKFSNGKIRSDGWLNKGRWPANLIHDGSEEVLELFPSPHGAGDSRGGGLSKNGGSMFCGNFEGNGMRFGDSGSAARFFYCAKASRTERGKDNKHPTVKPLALMRYLCRLVTPPNGLILDPFMGSGTTGMAAKVEGFRFIGIELDGDHHKIAEKRINAIVYEPKLIPTVEATL